jgi:simple sugar transport system permease protein
VDVLNRSAPVALLAIGMSLVIATGGIDLSVGTVIAITGAVCANVLNSDWNSLALVITCGVAAGIVAGMVNGSLISFFGIQPIIATLVLMVAGRGIAQLINGGQIITFHNQAQPGYSFLLHPLFPMQ